MSAAFLPFPLRKLLPWFLLPFGASLLLILLGLITRKRLFILAGVTLLCLSGMPFVSGEIVSVLEQQYPLIEPDACPPADAIVVLGGMVRRSPASSQGIEWSDSVDRFEQAIRLMKLAKAPLLIFTGARVPWQASPESEGELLRQAAIDHGIAASAIVVTPEVNTTAGEALAIQNLAADRKLRSIILVTTGWHLPRAMLLFGRTGLQVTPFPVDLQRRNPAEPRTILDFLPSAGAVGQTELVLRECYGLLYYRFIKRVPS